MLLKLTNIALELHFNAASSQANGCECLAYFKNEQAKKYAELFMKKLKAEYGSNIRKEWNKLKEKKTVPITDKEREIFNLNNNRKGTVKNKSNVKSKKKKTQYKNRRK